MSDGAVGRPGGTGGVLLRREFRADHAEVRRAIAAAIAGVENSGMDEDARHGLELALAEALTNVVEHAYSGVEGGAVTLILRDGRSAVLCEVRDRGRSMPEGRAPRGSLPAPDGAALPVCGFGFLLIRELATDLIYDRRDDENFLVFRIAKRTAPSRAARAHAAGLPRPVRRLAIKSP